jgi:hypothetical protein
MYNEKDYKIFEKDNLTLPTAIIQTNESGMATFVLPREEWFSNAVATVPDIRGTRRGRP